jgi:predicted KAP-like P-loop ATPase
LQNGAQLTINASQTLSVCGTWKGGSTSNASVLGAGTVVMNGTGAQTISGKTNFINLTINNTGGLTKVLGTVNIKTALIFAKR